GHDNVIRRSLRRGVRAPGIIRGIFIKITVGTEAAVYFIGGYMVKERRAFPQAFPYTVLAFPIFTRGFEKLECSEDIRIYKFSWPPDGAVYMRFRGEMHY